MKIILDCKLMRNPNSGLYYYCLNLGNYVNDLLGKKRLEPMKFYVRKQQQFAFRDADNIICEESYHRLYRPFLQNCDIWHAPFQSGRIVPRSKKIKVLLTIHDLNSLHEIITPERKKKSLAKTQRLINRSDAIVCISEFCRQDVLQHLDVKDTPVYVIHNGIHGLAEPRLSNTSYHPARPFLFGIGYINRKKNYQVLLSLLSNDVELVLSGKLDDPDYIQSIMAAAKETGVEDKVHITGPVNENEKAWYLQNCLAFVHPSLAEGFGTTVAEAMSVGKPLFLSGLTSLPEVGGELAYYFKSFEPGHMQEVFTKGMVHFNQHNLSQQLIERAKQFDWKQKAESYFEVYQSLME